MTEMVTSGLMRGCWRRSDGPLEGDTRPKRGETAWPRTPCTPPRQRPTLLVVVSNDTRAGVEHTKQELASFLASELHLTLSPDKTVITHVNDGFNFLGFHIRRSRPEG